MKKILILFCLSIAPLMSWAVTKIDAQTYTNPSQLPPAFTWVMERYDICDPGTNFKNENHTQTGIVVTWDPNYVNSSGSYGRLYIENFFTNDSLVNACDIDFNNLNNRNFMWEEDGSKLYFAFQSYNFSQMISLSGWTYWPQAFLASAKKSTSNGTYWGKGTQSTYFYDGSSQVICELNLTNKTIEINRPWGIFPCHLSGGQPDNSRVLKYYTRSTFYVTDLVDIIRDKEEGDEVTVSDDLLCVAFLPQFSYDNNGTQTQIGSVLVAKDLGKYENKNVNTADVFDYMKETGLFPSYDQSNWVVLTSNNYEPSTRDTYVGHILKGGTVKGTFTDKRNPTIALSEMPTPGDAMSYTPNVYVVPSFNDDYAATGSEFFFVQPKPQEYCQVMWATYDEDTDAFYVPTSEGNTNSHNLKGGFMWDKTYLDSGTASDEIVYNFHAMVNALPPTTESYNVWVHAINWNSELIEDENNFIYATVNGNKVFGEWPGKRLTHMRKAYDGYGTQSNWYYVSFGTTKPDLIIFSRGGSNQTGDITDFEKGDNFYNYFMDGYQPRYERLIGCYVTPQSNPTTLRETGTPDVGSGVSSRYVVMPISLDYNSVITGVRNIDATLGAPVSVTYYNTMGIASSRPHTGINIVVSRYADGTVSTAKTIVARGR